MPKLVAATVGLILGLSAWACPADARDRSDSTRSASATSRVDAWSSAKRKKRAKRTAQPAQPQAIIACTRGGCRPVPPGCQAVTERMWDGSPSGFQAIVCPYR